MIDEAFPVVGTLQEIVDLPLECGPAGDLPVLAGGVAGGFAPFRRALDEQGGGVEALAAGGAGGCKTTRRCTLYRNV